MNATAAPSIDTAAAKLAFQLYVAIGVAGVGPPSAEFALIAR